jgi:hypothetical protein
MVTRSGAGRTCWTSSPAGIRGMMCLGTFGFQRRTVFLLCAHPAPQPHPTARQVRENQDCSGGYTLAVTWLLDRLTGPKPENA